MQPAVVLELPVLILTLPLFFARPLLQ